MGGTRRGYFNRHLHAYSDTYLRRLCSHLDADLQDGDGELRVWATAEPQSEVRVRLLHLQLLHQLIQLRHPTEGQVTVGQKYPVTLQQGSGLREQAILQTDAKRKDTLGDYWSTGFT